MATFNLHATCSTKVRNEASTYGTPLFELTLKRICLRMHCSFTEVCSERRRSRIILLTPAFCGLVMKTLTRMD
ncbi:hypothetical protein LINGRAHAP2_LOCUS17569 [Linum grandiflorum]